MPALAAYVKDNRLCVMGVEESEHGPIPFGVSCKVESPDGPVDFESTTVEVARAYEGIKDQIMQRVEQDKMKAACADYVERARQGDQNAMAVIQQVRVAAEKGSPKAQLTKNLMADHIKRHPVENAPNVGYEPVQKIRGFLTKAFAVNDPLHTATAIKVAGPSDPNGAIVRLANGANLLSDKGPSAAVDAIIKGFPPNCHSAFMMGMDEMSFRKLLSLTMSPDCKRAMQVGYCVGIAKRIQAVRKPGVPIALLSPEAAWELGE